MAIQDPELDVMGKLIAKVNAQEKRIEELEGNEFATVRIKGTTGDYSTGYSGQIVINTVDNNIKMWAESAWRTLVSY